MIYDGIQNFGFPFQDKISFENWIHASLQQIKSLPLALQNSCCQRIAELYLQSTKDWQPKGRQCIYQVDGLMVIALKPKRNL